ncbi:MAG: ribosomal protein S18-alanine N-acetyltransferase [Methanocellales archaeon]
MDFSRVLSIHEENFNEFADPWLYMKAYEVCDDLFLVSMDGDELIGFVVGMQVDSDRGRILSIAVSKNYRNRGIGSALMNEILKRFKKANLKFACLEVRVSNKAAQLFYEKLGFKKIGIIENYYEDGENAYLMEKEI